MKHKQIALLLLISLSAVAQTSPKLAERSSQQNSDSTGLTQSSVGGAIAPVYTCQASDPNCPLFNPSPSPSPAPTTQNQGVGTCSPVYKNGCQLPSGIDTDVYYCTSISYQCQAPDPATAGFWKKIFNGCDTRNLPPGQFYC